MEYQPPESNIKFVKNMSLMWPEFKEVVDINVKLYDKILPHGVMADYAQIIWDTYEQTGATDFVIEVLNFIDSAYEDSVLSDNSDLESLIISSFIYNISSAKFKDISIIKYMPPRLSELSSNYL